MITDLTLFQRFVFMKCPTMQSWSVTDAWNQTAAAQQTPASICSSAYSQPYNNNNYGLWWSVCNVLRLSAPGMQAPTDME